MNTLVSTGFILLSEQTEMTRLFDLDFQLLHDAALMIIAVFFLFLIASNLLFDPVRNLLHNRQEKLKIVVDRTGEDKENGNSLKLEYAENL